MHSRATGRNETVCGPSLSRSRLVRLPHISATARRSKVVAMRRPKARALATCTVPTLVLLAEQSRAHHPRRAAAAARRLLPGAGVVTLRGASHHSLPTEQPAELNRLLTEFLA
ncbi:alpha/beta hydrolase [Streptomyces sp. D2-8]|uniref:alpha/beta fold hydrolase n=1 Tax=Streptomyces sp. D2-8 TaxID=2707767 RepID=UPI0020C1405C|nr:alpha/beta hydrolase [Streptomyces sp. D2-8]MCK8433199.1 alpha/beta hydrolase [Streptomyces sp. D2-8]